MVGLVAVQGLRARRCIVHNLVVGRGQIANVEVPRFLW